jgi:hypothetical protein
MDSVKDAFDPELAPTDADLTVTRATLPDEPPEPPPAEPAPPPPAEPKAEGAPPAAEPTPPKKWADRYEKPEELEVGYKELQRADTEKTATIKRLETLLDATLQARPTVGTPAAPDTPKPATRALVELVSRAAVGDEGVTDQVLLEALETALTERPGLRTTVREDAMRHLQTMTAAQKEGESIKAAFFAKYPGATRVKDYVLHPIAREAELRLFGGPAPKERLTEWFDAVAADLKGMGLDPTKGEDPSPTPTEPRREPPRGVRSEGGGGGPAPTPALSGQAKELDEVFGRR